MTAHRPGSPAVPARPGRTRLVEGIAVAVVYAALAGILAGHHEPWFDEAQAWLLARDAGPAHLFLRQLRYEGTPGLWHALLMLPARAGAPYWTMTAVSVASGTVAAFLVGSRSPFPRPVRLLLPFGFFLFYQYGVVARSYSLLAPLLFLVAAAYPRRHERVGVYTALLCLVANTSGHGAAIAGALMALHAVEAVRGGRRLGTAARRAHLFAYGCFAAVAALIGFQLLPIPEDLDFPHGFPVTASTLWASTTELLGGAVAPWGPATVAVLAGSVVYLVRARTVAAWLLPTAAVLVFATYGFRNVWHEGILFVLLVFGLWVAAAARPDPPSCLWRVGMAAILLPVLVLHASWSVRAWRYDVAWPYSGSRALAAFLRDDPRARGAVVYTTGFASFAVLPYLEHNPFANVNGGRRPVWWPWSTRAPMLVDPGGIVARAPDLVVLTLKYADAHDQLGRYPGYRVLRSFPGHLWWKDRILEPDTFVVLEREGRVPSGAGPAAALPDRSNAFTGP